MAIFENSLLNRRILFAEYARIDLSVEGDLSNSFLYLC